MAEKITEEQVGDLQAILRTDASVDAKVQHVNNIKSGIKQNNVPETCVYPLFEAIRSAMTSPHAALANAGYSTLNHFLTRLSRQEPKHLVKEAGRTLPLVIDKMGDQKEKYRQLAAQCLTSFWKVSPLDVERIVKNAGLVSKNPRMKEASMSWVLQMHQENGMPFKAFVSTLMELLEDADGMVRDTARNVVIELFKNAPNAAKSDLKRQMKNFNVRQTIVTAITSHLGPNGPAEAEAEVAEAPSRQNLAASVVSNSSTRPTTPGLEAKLEHVEPSYVNTQRELDEIFKEMHQFFEGKESEQNWLKREQSCTKLRRLNAGNAPSDYREAFIAGIRSLLDGILKAVNSLRTSLSKEGCSVIQEVVRMVGPGLDPMVEILLQNLIKLCAGTKKISSQQGNVTVDIIISKVSYSHRIIYHILQACQDKNVQPRTYSAGWLKTVLKKEAHHKNHLEHSGGLDMIEKCVKRGLTDANPGVREGMRSTYWAFAQMWPAKAEGIMSNLEATQQRLLENCPDNPNSPKKVEGGSRPGSSFSKSVSGPPKPSLREAMAAQKKAAMASKNLPARPGSAMSALSPMRNVSGASAASEAGPARLRHETSAPARSGLSAAPTRPAKMRTRPEVSRPEITRPATAGPYSVRRPVHAPTNSESGTTATPAASRAPKARTPSASSASPRKLIPRPNTSHSTYASQQPNHTSPGRTAAARVAPSPRGSPGKPKPSAVKPSPSSPAKVEEPAVAIPTISGTRDSPAINNAQAIESSDEEDLATPLKSLKVYEDPFSNTDDQSTPRPTVNAPVLEEVAVNEDASNLARNATPASDASKAVPLSPERSKQNSRLLDSGINKIKAKTLDVHGFRKLQGMIRDNKAVWSDNKFDVLVLGLFEFLEAPLTSLTPDKVQDVKAQILATINLMYKKDRDSFVPHVSRGLESILVTRSCYDARAHIVSGLELLVDELVTLAEPAKTVGALLTQLSDKQMTLEGCRVLNMGLHMLKELLDAKTDFKPSAAEVAGMCALATRCLDSVESGVRLEAVQLCVSLHSRLGDGEFWAVMGGVRDDPKSLITYYIVKKQREVAASS